MKVFAVYNNKGGVGKTATAVTLAYLSARQGVPTLLWDLDPQGAATYTYRIETKVKGGARGITRSKTKLARAIRASDYEGLDVVPAEHSMRDLDLFFGEAKRPKHQLQKLLRGLRSEYGRVFLDCAPSISLVSQNIFEVSDALLIPTIPTPLSLRTLAQLIAHLGERGGERPAVLPFFCMLDRRKKAHGEIVAHAREAAQGFLETSIPYASSVEQMAFRRQPLPVYAGGDAATLAYSQLWEEVLARLGSEGKSARPSRKRLRSALELVRESLRRTARGPANDR